MLDVPQHFLEKGAWQRNKKVPCSYQAHNASRRLHLRLLLETLSPLWCSVVAPAGLCPCTLKSSSFPAWPIGSYSTIAPTPPLIRRQAWLHAERRTTTLTQGSYTVFAKKNPKALVSFAETMLQLFSTGTAPSLGGNYSS